MDKTCVSVNIAGQTFRLAGDESEEYIRRIAGYLNEKVAEAQRAYPNLSSAACVTMAALNISDELHKLKENYEALDSRISELRDMPRQTPMKRPFESKAATAK